MSTTQFVINGYRNLLGREPSVAEIINVRDFDDATVLTIFIDSPEAEVKVGGITRLYYAFFNRPPDEEGLLGWRAQLLAGKSLADISEGFVGSQEFETTFGSLSNLAFVVRLYNNVLNREPDAEGLAAHTGALAVGVSRGTIMLGFSESAEFQVRRASEVDVVAATLATTGTVLDADEVASRAALSKTEILSLAVGDQPLSASLAGGTLTLANKAESDGGLSLDLSASPRTLKDGTDDVNLGGGDLSTVTTVNAAKLSSVLKVTGSAGADTIIGGLKADTITGGLGNDTLTGGGAADTFVISTTGTAGGTLTKADTTAAVDAEQITITADDTDNTDETLTVTFTLNGTTATTTTIATSVLVTDAAAVATAVAAELNKVTGITASASGAVVTATADSGGALSLDTVTIGGTTNGLAGTRANGTDVAEVDTLTVGGTPATGDVFSVTLLGQTVTYVAASGDGTAQVVNGLVAALNANTTVAAATTAAATGTTTLTITDDNADNGGLGTVAATVAGGRDSGVIGTAGGDVITDFNTGGSDILRLTAANDVAGAATNTAVAGTTVQISVGGKVTFAAADDTLAEKVAALIADDANVANNEVVFFEEDGNTFIYGAGAATTDPGADFLIQLTGVTGLTTLSEATATAGDFTLA